MTSPRTEKPTTVQTTIRSWWAGLAIGTAAALAGLYAMRYPYQEWFRAASNQEVADHRLAVLWLLLLGGGILAIVLAGRHNPLIVVIPAIVWVGTYGPFLFNLQFPDWSPDWVNSWILASYGVHIPIIIGLLSTAAIWNTWTHRARHLRDAP